MVGILCHRVYKVINPEDLNQEAPPRIAGTVLPPDAPRPGDPPPPPSERPGTIPDVLWKKNMFFYTPAGGSRTALGPDDTEDQVAVLGFQETPKGWAARIQTASTRKWYREGEKFETWELVSVDPEAGCVELYGAASRKRKKVCLDTGTQQ